MIQRRDESTMFGLSPIWPMNFVARTMSSRRSAMPLPTMTSDSPAL
jgi:hypothetical protein